MKKVQHHAGEEKIERKGETKENMEWEKERRRREIKKNMENTKLNQKKPKKTAKLKECEVPRNVLGLLLLVGLVGRTDGSCPRSCSCSQDYLRVECINATLEVNILLDEFKGTVRVISSDPSCKDGNARFTTVPFKAFSVQVRIKF